MEVEELKGLLVDEVYRFDEPLYGWAASGRFRGTATRGPNAGRRVIITSAVTRDALASAVADPLLFDGISGVAPLLCSTVFDAVFPAFSVLVELEPEGAALGTLAVPLAEPLALGIGLQLCGLAEAARDCVSVLGGIRPEQVYLRADMTLSGIAPRGFRFCTAGLPGSYWVDPPFRDCFESPELRWRKPVTASDVYMIAGTIQFLVSGSPPFAGRNWVLQRDATLEEAPLAYPGGSGIGQVLRAALSIAAEDRPSLGELAAALAG